MRVLADTHPPGESPHPRPAEAALIARIGATQHRLLPRLDDAGVRTTLVPAHYPQPPQRLCLADHICPRGRVVDPFTHLRQRAFEHRAPDFRRLPYGAVAEPFDPETAEPTASELRQLIADVSTVQIERHATLILTPYHVAGGVDTPGRALELLLAEAAVRHFRRQALHAAPEAIGVTREIYVAIAVRARDLLRPEVRLALAEAYLGLDERPDGYWVNILNFNERARPRVIAACGAFLELLRAAGLPVVSSGPGQLALGLLANDFAVCIGIGESERFVWPTNWREMPRTKEGKAPGRARYAYHGGFGRSFKVTSNEARRAFELDPCWCPHHDPNVAPPQGADVDLHAVELRLREFNNLCVGDIASRRGVLVEQAQAAEKRALVAGLKYTSSAQFNALFAGIDDPGIALRRTAGS